MAGDWLPIRLDLHDDPAVIAIASVVGLDEYAVVGRLLKLWAWANRNTTDGNAQANARGVTSAWVDRYLSLPGFGAAMIESGWLVQVTDAAPGVLCIPNFDRWNSQGAKQRLLTARRVAAHSARVNARANASGNAGTNAPSVSEALPKEENRRGKKKDRDTPLPPAKPGGGAVEPPTPDLKAETGPDPEAESVTKFAELVGEWVAAKLPGHDSANGIQRTPNRVGHWQARLRDPTWATRWRDAVRRAGRSARCRGEDPKWPQGLRLDTFVSNRNSRLWEWRMVLPTQTDSVPPLEA